MERNGAVRASAVKNYPLLHPKPAWAEQNPRDWTRATVDGIKDLLAKAQVDCREVVAIGISSQIDGVIPIDEKGECLYNAIIWMDRRAKPQCNEIRTSMTEEMLYSLTGLSIDPSHIAPKIMWIRDNLPDAFRKTDCFLLPANFLLFFLTGEAYTDHSNASCSMLYDIKRGEWSSHLCELFEIPKETLPSIRDSTHVAGNMRHDLTQMCGLSEDVKVTVGGGDEEVGAIGAGVIDQGALLDLTGTSEPMCLCLDRPFLDPTRLLECHAHAHPGKWLLENTGGLAGGIYKWFKDQFALPEAEEAQGLGVETYEILNREISLIRPGSEGLLFLPFFSGSILPEWNPDARGVFLGLTLGHTRPHLARSIMEGSAYILKDAVEHLARIGLSPTRIVLAGGGARADIWRQIKTDIISHRTVRCTNEEVTALGGAIIAAVGSGLYKSFDEAVGKMVRVSDELFPSPTSVEIYGRLYQIYRQTYQSLKPVFPQIAVLQETEPPS